jgi:hypothetical protein
VGEFHQKGGRRRRLVLSTLPIPPLPLLPGACSLSLGKAWLSHSPRRVRAVCIGWLVLCVVFEREGKGNSESLRREEKSGEQPMRAW